MELVHTHIPKEHRKMRFDISQILVTISFITMWYSNYFTYDFITPIFQFFHGMYLAYQDSSLIQYMAQRTQVLNEARMQGESTIDKVLDILVRIITGVGGFVFLILTPTGVELGARLKKHIFSKFTPKKKRKNNDIL